MHKKILIAAAGACAAASLGIFTAFSGRQATPAAKQTPDADTLRAFLQAAESWQETRAQSDGVQLHMADAQNGWRTDGKSVYYTADGGKSWRSAAPFYDGGALAFTGTNTAAALAKTVKDEMSLTGLSVYATADAGKSWKQTAFSGEPLFSAQTLVRGIDGFDMADNKNGLLLLAGDAAAGSHDSAVYATSDGGTHFTQKNAELRLPNGDGTLRQADARHALLFINNAAEPAQLFATADGGTSWKAAEGLPSSPYTDITPMLYPARTASDGCVALFESQNGLENYPAASGSKKIVGQDAGMRAVFMRLNEDGDADSVFATLRTALPIDGRSVSMPDAQTIFVCTRESGRTVLLRFTEADGWTYAAQNLPDGVLQIQFISDTEGFLLMQDALYTTRDGGANWSRLPF